MSVGEANSMPVIPKISDFMIICKDASIKHSAMLGHYLCFRKFFCKLVL